MNHIQFRRWRKRRKLTQVQTAKLLQVSLSTICSYEAPPKQTKHRRVPGRTAKLIRSLDKLADLQATG